LTVSATLVEFESLSSAPVEPLVGAFVSLLRAAFRLAIVPDGVNEGEPAVLVVKLDPVVGLRVSLPFETDSESESELLPAAASITEIALLLPLEKTSEMFSLSGAAPGAVIAGAARALTVSDALFELDSASPGLVTTFTAEFTLATGLDAVKVPEPLVPAVKLNPVAEPRAIVVPCETVCESESAPESVIESALPLPPEGASDPFWANDAETGALTVGALKAVTVSATLVEADSVSPGSVTETDNESEPE
jgi:hypothetical protein